MKANDAAHSGETAASILAKHGISYDPASDRYHKLCLELSRLDAMYWEIQTARVNGD